MSKESEKKEQYGEDCQACGVLGDYMSAGMPACGPDRPEDRATAIKKKSPD